MEGSPFSVLIPCSLTVELALLADPVVEADLGDLLTDEEPEPDQPSRTLSKKSL